MATVLDHVDDEEQVDRAGVLVELRLHLAVLAEGPLGGGQDRLLERLDQDLAVDVLVLGHLVEDHVEVGTFAHDALLKGPGDSPLRRNAASQSGTRCAPRDFEYHGDLVAPAVALDFHGVTIAPRIVPEKVPAHHTVSTVRTLTFCPAKRWKYAGATAARDPASSDSSRYMGDRVRPRPARRTGPLAARIPRKKCCSWGIPHLYVVAPGRSM